MWYIESEIGTIRIVPISNNKFSLLYDDDNYGGFNSPEAAADDVYSQTTGCDEIDCYDGEFPSDLSEWKRSK